MSTSPLPETRLDRAPENPAGNRPRKTRTRRHRIIRNTLLSVGSVIAGVLVIGIGFLVYSGADAPWTFESRVAGVEGRFADGYPQGEVLLTGSSYFEYWETSEDDLAPLESINVGIGGTKIGDQAAFVERLVVPFDPRAVVVYAGSNDINGIPFFSKSGADVASRVQAYLEDLHERLPSAKLFYVAITEAPIRAGVRDEIQTANQSIADYADSTDYVTFIETAPALLTPDGAIDGSLFRDDNLHFNETGYEKFVAAIRPVLLDGLD